LRLAWNFYNDRVVLIAKSAVAFQKYQPYSRNHHSIALFAKVFAVEL
jgi:hypothetical protein